MDQITGILQNKPHYHSIQSFFVNLYETMHPHIDEIQNLKISFSNPVFGLFIILTLLLLSQIWGLKKAFSYCFTVASILYLTSKITIHLAISIDTTALTYADIIKAIAIILIIIITIYYIFVKSE